jgi:hypothetical protein
VNCAKRFAALVALVTFAAAQQPAPKPDEQPGGVFRLPSQMPEEPKPAPKPEEAKPATLQFDGKPLTVPFACTDDDITGFGMTCSAEDPCPVYLELSHLQPLGAKVFVSGNLHNGATTMYSILLASEDSGKTWMEPFERIRGAGLEQIQFVDFETGWVAGQLLGAVPRDPFFVLTTDGGKNWRRRPLFSEPRISAIEQFYFESRTRGALLVDRVQGTEAGARYELYESMTGGDTWMIREVSSKPLQLKGAKPLGPPPDWRLRADPAAKAHVIEKRAGQRWQTVASFNVLAGTCKPEAAALPEPPPPPEPPSAETAPASPGARPAPRPPTLKKK